MTYAVKEIFYTLQGEGAHAGRPAVFLRFSGCNLWTGLERDRDKGPGGCSRWCDTDFVGGVKFRTAADLFAAVVGYWPRSGGGQPFVVCTGGEPLLQLDAPLVSLFNDAGWTVAVETNGTVDPPPGKLWLTVSPKAGSELRVLKGNELKLVFPQVGAEPARFEQLEFDHFFLQPMDSVDKARNTQQALEYCLAHPQWWLSLQTHKILDIR
jgi:7-carboxy-7-deazaguanine synthase (Cx14CxxC type)